MKQANYPLALVKRESELLYSNTGSPNTMLKLAGDRTDPRGYFFDVNNRMKKKSIAF